MRPAPKSSSRPAPTRAVVSRCALGLVLISLALGTLRPIALANEDAAITTTNAPVADAPAADTNTPQTSASSESDAPRSSALNAPAASNLDFPAFKLIADRNIFNTTRSARRPGGGRPRETRRAPKIESVSLLGTLAYEKGRFAFFEGSSSEYRKVLRQGDSIAGHTIESISQSGIRLTQGDRVLNLKVSQHLRREDDGDWQLSDTAAAPAATASTSSSSSTSSTDGTSASADTTSPASSAGGEVSDILKRLMQQREKELK